MYSRRRPGALQPRIDKDVSDRYADDGRGSWELDGRPCKCPYCRSNFPAQCTALQASSGPESLHGGGERYFIVECNRCGAAWYECYRLHRIVGYALPTASPIEMLALLSKEANDDES